ncbi:hypothetical protein J5N97_016295 [Dioscorea zingiberensis]|uniref:Uncharacterized protein n=1 Tax=Dioscorea zingiberensis TaxID=325984 RepID=A0A9D5CJR1_9LILI|nr:hypothetical protein J5N97_016295 [Dioscorea zingiberensis]
MSADSNMSFHQGFVPSPMYNSRLVSFQSGATNSMAGIVPVGLNNSGPISSTVTGMRLVGNPSMIPNSLSVIQSGCSSSNNLLDSVPCLKHDTGLVVEWTLEEQAKLKQGLIKYANEPNIMKYIKIASFLPDKTVRDVALRCRWMMKKDICKRRKAEDSYLGKKIKDRKEKMVDSSPKMNVCPVQSNNIPAYSQLMHQIPQNQFLYEAPVIDSVIRNLLDENGRILGQITANLASFKIQDNLRLFYHMRNNTGTILTRMSEMPGVMSRMPPLPVTINEELLSNILPGVFLPRMPGGNHFKQDPSY